MNWFSQSANALKNIFNQGISAVNHAKGTFKEVEKKASTYTKRIGEYIDIAAHPNQVLDLVLNDVLNRKELRNSVSRIDLSMKPISVLGVDMSLVDLVNLDSLHTKLHVLPNATSWIKVVNGIKTVPVSLKVRTDATKPLILSCMIGKDTGTLVHISMQVEATISLSMRVRLKHLTNMKSTWAQPIGDTHASICVGLQDIDFTLDRLVISDMRGSEVNKGTDVCRRMGGTPAMGGFQCMQPDSYDLHMYSSMQECTRSGKTCDHVKYGLFNTKSGYVQDTCKENFYRDNRTCKWTESKCPVGYKHSWTGTCYATRGAFQYLEDKGIQALLAGDRTQIANQLVQLCRSYLVSRKADVISKVKSAAYTSINGAGWNRRPVVSLGKYDLVVDVVGSDTC